MPYALDINECANASTHSCSEVKNEVCRNTNGSYMCECMPGFTLIGADRSCEGKETHIDQHT